MALYIAITPSGRGIKRDSPAQAADVRQAGDVYQGSCPGSAQARLWRDRGGAVSGSLRLAAVSWEAASEPRPLWFSPRLNDGMHLACVWLLQGR